MKPFYGQCERGHLSALSREEVIFIYGVRVASELNSGRHVRGLRRLRPEECPECRMEHEQNEEASITFADPDDP
jgi:hypothetical protein